MTEYVIQNYNIDTDRVYLHGYSGGGETGSLIMGKNPELFAAYLITSSKWDGDMNVLAKTTVPVYMATGESDSYYGSKPLKDAYAELHSLYQKQGLSEAEVDHLLTLDIKEQEYFSSAGYSDQHMGGMAFAHDEEIMGWLFSEHV